MCRRIAQPACSSPCSSALAPCKKEPQLLFYGKTHQRMSKFVPGELLPTTADLLRPLQCSVDGAVVVPPQHFLTFLPLPQGQGSLRPTFGVARTMGVAGMRAWPGIARRDFQKAAISTNEGTMASIHRATSPCLSVIAMPSLVPKRMNGANQVGCPTASRLHARSSNWKPQRKPSDHSAAP